MKTWSSGEKVNASDLNGNFVELRKFGGDGSDGALDTSGGTVNIDCGGADLVEKNYTSINVATNNLTFSNPGPNGTIVILRSQGNVVVSATIDVSGLGAAGGVGGAAVGPGNGNPGTNGSEGIGILDDGANHKGLGGNNGTGTSGGSSQTGGTIYSNKFLYTTPALLRLRRKCIYLATGSGGGGGASGSDGGGAELSGAGGNGGRGGGALLIQCAGDLNFTGTIDVSGDDGQNGGVAQGSKDYENAQGGGGGGGASGMCVVLYNTATSTAGTITAKGGNGGTGGSSDNNGTSGSNAGGGGGGSGGGCYSSAGGAGGNGGNSNQNGGAGGGAVGAGGGGGGGAGDADGTTKSGGSGGTSTSDSNLYKISQNVDFS